MRLTALLFLLLGAFTTSFFGQDILTVYTQYTVEEGLPSNTLNYVMQDSKGYLWLLGDRKAIRYNGKAFEEIELPALPTKIWEDSQGRLWVSTYYFLGYIEDMKLRAPAPYADDIYETLVGTCVRSIMEDENGDIIYTVDNNKSKGNAEEKLYTHAFRIGKDSLETIYLPEDTSAFLVGEISYLKSLSQGKFLFSGRAYNTQKKFPPEIRVNQTFDEITVNRPLAEVIQLRDGSYVGATISAFVHFNKDSVFYFSRDHFGANIRCFLEDHVGNIWIGTREGIWQAPEGDFEKLKKNKNLPNWVLTSITEDSEHNIWVATEGSGLIKFSSSDLERLAWKYEEANNNIVDLELHDEELWISNNVGRLIKINADNNIDHIDIPHEGGAFSLASVGNSILTGHRWQIEKDKKSMLGSLKGRSDWMNKEYFRIMLPAGGDNIWTTSKTGTILFNLKTQTVLYDAEAHGFKKNLTDMDLDPQGKLWLTSSSGDLFYKENDSILSGFNIYPELDSLRGRDYLWGVLFSNSGHMFLRMQEGIIIHTDAGFQVLRRRKELIGSKDFSINYLEEDKSLWVCAFGGIDKFVYDEVQKKYVKSFSLGKKEGLPIQSEGELLKFNDKLYLGTASGVYIIDEAKIGDNSLPLPPVFITGLELFDSSYLPGQEIELLNTQNNPIFHVDAISFQKSEKITYHHRLVGHKEVWEKSENQSLRYTNLKPGNYVFEVIASRNGVKPEGAPQQLSFKIIPHFTQTWFFIVALFTLAGLLLGYVVYAFVRWKDRQDRRQMLTTELKYQALQSQMSPHFIFNAMNSISYLVKNKKSKEADKYLNKFAGLLRGVLENAQYSFITLLDEIELVQSYLELEQLQFGKQFQFNIDMDPELMAYELQLPPMLIQPIIENAIRHGISPRGYGTVKVDFKNEDKQLRVSIEDDGVGRAFAEELKKQSLTHTPKTQVGIQNIRERINVLNHLYGLNMEMKIVDLETVGEATGTQVVFTFPKIKYLPEIQNSSFTSFRSFTDNSETEEYQKD